MFSVLQLKLSFFATAHLCESIEGETCHSLLSLGTAKLPFFERNLARLVLGAITKTKDQQ